jgi:hypothetical protein
VTTGTTIFSDNFESAPQISTADAPDTSVDADPVAQVGTWDTTDGTPPNAYGLEVQVTNDSSPGAFQGSNYLRLYRDGSGTNTYTNSDTYATMSTAPVNGQTIHMETMVYLPAGSPNARMQLMFQGTEGDNNTDSAWVRPDGNGGVSYVGAGFDVEPTGLSYSTNVWQEWAINYVVGSDTFSLTVGNNTDSSVPVFGGNLVNYIHFGNGNNTPGSFYLDSTSVPEPTIAGIASIALMTLGRRRRV